LKLYKALERLGDRVLYYDTDSVVYVARAGEDPNVLMPLGKYLGDWTNELGKDKYNYGDLWIDTWGSLGPKSYGYELNTKETEFKSKGFSTKRQGVASKLNFKAMLSILLEGAAPIKISGDAIRRPELFKVRTIKVSRTFRDCYMKRERLPPAVSKDGEIWMIDTVPWKKSTERKMFKAIGKKYTHPREETKEIEEEKKEGGPPKRRRKQSTKKYSVYLLQSVSDPRVFYTGSSPDPARRLRQHNGEVVGGAEETILHRPWKHFAILEGFVGRSAATTYEKAVQTAQPALVEKDQVTEPLKQLRRFLWSRKIYHPLKLFIMDPSYEESARLWKDDRNPDRITLCL